MSKTLANADIVPRIKDYFGRQIAFFEHMRDALTDIANAADPERLDNIVDDDAIRARQGKDLEDEFNALKKEWDAAESISEEDQRAVRTLASRATELATDLQSALDAAAQHSEGQAATIGDNLGDLRQGRDWLTKYRPTESTDGGFIDHQA